MRTKQILLTIAFSVLGGFVAAFAFNKFATPQKVQHVYGTQYDNNPSFAGYAPDIEGTNIDFTYAAERTVHAVVHVKVQAVQNQYSQGNSIYDFFFGYRDVEPRRVEGYGSGVIISQDGYIITNNHVIKDAQLIEVTLNDKRSFIAKLIGTDPATDIALLKIDAEDLAVIPFGNSDALKVGEWVLAVGNPYNLTSTVTAGIVSAKSRQLGIIRPEEDEELQYDFFGQQVQPQQRQRRQASLGIESFIQTDAAVNPGNSGGALVNIKGELVGINTAIQSRTGSYSGNSFAVPTTIVKKVVEDLRQFGSVQRAVLGISMSEVTAELAQEYDLDQVRGVYVIEVSEDSAAEKAGLKSGDVIVAIDGKTVNNASEVQEQISRFRPKDSVRIDYVRDGKQQTTTAELKGLDEVSDVSAKTNGIEQKLGASFEQVPSQIQKRLGIDGGVRIKEITGRGCIARAGVPAGFIIVSVDKKTVKTEDQLMKAFEEAQGGYVLIEGFHSNGLRAAFALQIE